MAQQLTTGLNFFELGGAVDVISNSIPTDFNTQGIAKQNGETGFFVRSDKNYTLYIYYTTSGWVEYGSIDVTDEDYGTGVSIPWLEDLTHGLPMAAYFVTSESEHELRIFSKRGRISADLLPGNSDISKNTLVHSLADTALDDDGKITGRSTIAEFSVDTTLFAGGDTVTFSTDGDFWYGHVLVNAHHEIPANISYNAASDQTQVTFELPNIHDSSHDRYSIHLSLKESVPAVPKYILTANTYVIDENGEVTITLSTQNVTAGTTLPWTISGTGIDSNDFSQGDFLDATALTGEFVVGTTDSVSFTMQEDLTTEGNEVFTLSLDGGQANVSIVVNDTSTTPVAAPPNGFKFIATVGDDAYGDGSLEMRLGGRGNYTVDWGDGTVETIGQINADNMYDVPVHNYATPGSYEIHMYNGNSTFDLHNAVDSSFNQMLYGANIMWAEYVPSADTNNEGPFTLGRPIIHSKYIPDLSNITNMTASGQTMTIVDSSNYNYANYFNGASFNNVEKVLIKTILANGERSYEPVTITTTGDTTTFTVSRGQITMDNLDTVEDMLADDGVAYAVSKMGSNQGIKVCLCPNLTAIPDFKLYVGAHNIMSDRFWNYVDNMPGSKVTKKITQITNWGADDFEFTSTRGNSSFQYCKHVTITASDEPDFTNQTSMDNFFLSCASLTDVNDSLNSNKFVHAGVTTMENMFMDCVAYDPSTLNNWDTSGCLSFKNLFLRARSFNATINDWVINTDPNSNVVFTSMFYQADVFNQDVNTNQRSDGQIAWDTQRVSNMSTLFFNAQQFNKSVEYWNTSNCRDFTYAFSNARVYNQPMNTQAVTVGGNTYTAWDVSQAYDFNYMFSTALVFNQDISNWDTSNAQTFQGMFYQARKYNQPMNTQSVTVNGNTYTAWDVKRSSGSAYSTKFHNMFQQAWNFNQDLSNWDVSDTPSLYATFLQAYSFEGTGVGNWDISGKTSLQQTFNACFYFNPDLSNWDASNVTNWRQTFALNHSLMFDFGNWNYTISPTDMYETFKEVGVRQDLQDSNLTEMDFSNWDVSGLTSLIGTFNSEYAHVNSTVARISDHSNYITSGSVPTTYYKFRRTWVPVISNWDVSNVTTMKDLFRHNPNIATNSNFDLSSWDVSNVTDASYIFQYCYGFDGQTTSSWNLNSLTNGTHAFRGCDLTTLNVSNWLPDSLTNPTYMFRENINFIGNGVENWNINPATTSLLSMFYKCHPFSGDVSNWDVSNITNMAHAFAIIQPSTPVTLDVSNWNTQSLTSVAEMFSQSNIDFDPTNWDVSNITNFNNWTFNNGADNWDQTRLDNVLAAWGSQTVQSDVNLTIDTGNNASFNSLSASGLAGYNNLVNNYNWTINIS